MNLKDRGASLTGSWCTSATQDEGSIENACTATQDKGSIECVELIEYFSELSERMRGVRVCSWRSEASMRADADRQARTYGDCP